MDRQPFDVDAGVGAARRAAPGASPRCRLRGPGGRAGPGRERPPGGARPPSAAGAGSAKWSRTWPPGIRLFSSAGVPSATIRPWSSTAIRSASWSASSRYWVVSRIVTPAAASSRTICHMVQAAARVQAGGGLVEEDHPGLTDEGHRQVEPSSHPARVGRQRLVRGVGEVELLQQLGDPPSPSVAAEVAKVGHQPQVLGAGEQVVHGRELPGDPDDGPHPIGIGDHVVTGDAHGAGIGRDQGGQDADHRGLPRPVRTQQREDRALLHGQAHLVEHHMGAERLAHLPGHDPARWRTDSSSLPASSVSWLLLGRRRGARRRRAAPRAAASTPAPAREADPPGSPRTRPTPTGSLAVLAGRRPGGEDLPGPARPAPGTRRGRSPSPADDDMSMHTRSIRSPAARDRWISRRVSNVLTAPAMALRLASRASASSLMLCSRGSQTAR